MPRRNPLHVDSTLKLRIIEVPGERPVISLKATVAHVTHGPKSLDLDCVTALGVHVYISLAVPPPPPRARFQRSLLTPGAAQLLDKI